MYPPAWPTGITARPFVGRSDFGVVADVFTEAMGSQSDESMASGDEIENEFVNTENFDLKKGLLIVESSERPIGYVLGRWNLELGGTYIYRHMGKLVPEFHRRGIGTAMFRWAQGYLRGIASGHSSADQQFQTYVDDTDTGAVLLMTGDGYRPVGHEASMLRASLDDIPERVLPPEVEIRPVHDMHLRQIWEADVEAFRDHAGSVEPTETDWQRFRGEPNQDPSLWKVAWHGDRVVGQVRSFINHEANAAYGRLRGYTEDISTARDWRGQGVAGALICESLRELKSRGLEEAGLGVHVENATGAFKLYESLGFKVTSSGATYQRPI